MTACNTPQELSSESNIEPPKPKPAVLFKQSDQLMPLLDQAKDENKVVFVDVYATWCMPCKVMDEDVFSDPATADFMNEHFINYKVDGEKGNGLKIVTFFDIKAYPTLLFLDGNGKVLLRQEGMVYPNELKRMAKKALAANASPEIKS